MTETAAHLVDHLNPAGARAPAVLSFPIPLRFMLAAHPHLLSPILQITQLAISILRSVDGTSLNHFSTFLIKQAGLKRAQAVPGAVILIQRFESAANQNIHLYCLVLDEVCHKGIEDLDAPFPKNRGLLINDGYLRVVSFTT